MFVLLSNDDGISAPGLAILEQAAARVFSDYAVVAPRTEQSGVSHGLTINRPIACRQHAENRWDVDGRPADCIFLALTRLLPRRPDLILSGVNAGPNLGFDTVYSGTAAAAREGLMQGIPSVAFSLAGISDLSMEQCLEPLVKILSTLKARIPSSPLMLNVNIPSASEFGPVVGFKACTLGNRVFANETTEWEDPRGNRYLWLGGWNLEFQGAPDTDTYWITKGYVTMTPMTWSQFDGTRIDETRELVESI